MYVEFNSMYHYILFIGRLTGGFRTLLTSVWELIYRLMNEPEVLLFLWCKNDILSISCLL